MQWLKNRKILWGYLFCIILIIFQVWNIFGPDKIYNYSLNTKEAKSMLIELLIVTVLILIINFLVKGKNKIILSALLILVFGYVHQTFWAILVAVFYFGIILFSGTLLTTLFFRNKTIKKSIWWFLSLILGLALVCLCVAFLSLFSIYSVKSVWIVLFATAIGGLLISIKNNRFSKFIISDEPEFCTFLSYLEVSILLQIGRVGLQADYDAFWYGLRSQQVLANSARGIYENLQLVGFTYLYPKGYEIILLPLTDFPSWNVQFLFGQILLVMTVLVSWLLSKEIADRNIAYVVSCGVATLPSFLSMAMTVKPDVITCLLQLTAVLLVYLYYKETENIYLVSGLAIIIFSYCFKITSILFSSVIIVGLVPFINLKKIKIKVKELGVLLIGILSFVLVWGRTFVLTGAPIIAFIGGIYEKLGFTTKYPYKIVGNINQAEVAVGDIFSKLIEGIWAYFVLPTGEGFSHVIIAWGSTLPLLISMISLFLLITRKNNLNFRWLWFIGLQYAALLFGIGFLSQNDGNYFLFFYVINIIVLGSFCLNYYKKLAGIFYIIMAFNLFFASFSNWSWSIGFTDIKIPNKGYVNQQESYESRYIDENGSEILSIINKNKENKLLAATLDVEKLINYKCITQRWNDIEVSNVNLLADATSLWEYLDRCGILYIYADDSAVTIGSRTEQLLLDLIKAGKVSDIIYEGSSALLMLGENEGDIYEFEQMALDFYTRRGKGGVKVQQWYEDGWGGKDIEFYGYSESGKLSVDIWIPFEISEGSNYEANVLVGDKQSFTLPIVEANISCVIDIPPNEYVKIKMNNNFCFKGEGDERELCYILNVSSVE